MYCFYKCRRLCNPVNFCALNFGTYDLLYFMPHTLQTNKVSICIFLFLWRNASWCPRWRPAMNKCVAKLIYNVDNCFHFLVMFAKKFGCACKVKIKIMCRNPRWRLIWLPNLHDLYKYWRIPKCVNMNHLKYWCWCPFICNLSKEFRKNIGSNFIFTFKMRNPKWHPTWPPHNYEQYQTCGQSDLQCLYLFSYSCNVGQAIQLCM